MSWQSERSERVLILRVWHEPDVSGLGSWRGSLQDITSGERSTFANVRDLADIVSLRLRDDRLSLEAAADRKRTL